MIPTSRRTRLASRTTSWPAIFTLPEVSPRVVVRIEMVVVLPAPFGPSSAKNCPCSTSKLTPSMAFEVPFRYRLTRSRTSIAGAISLDELIGQARKTLMPRPPRQTIGLRETVPQHIGDFLLDRSSEGARRAGPCPTRAPRHREGSHRATTWLVETAWNSWRH